MVKSSINPLFQELFFKNFSREATDDKFLSRQYLSFPIRNIKEGLNISRTTTD
jgi:hypothetical protein